MICPVRQFWLGAAWSRSLGWGERESSSITQQPHQSCVIVGITPVNQDLHKVRISRMQNVGTPRKAC